MGHYDTAQVCLNGHVINGYATAYPGHNEKFCGKCGERTIMQCESCHAPVRGDYHSDVPMLTSSFGIRAANYCHQCGHAYPWAERGLQAAKELADEFEGLSQNERDELKQSLDDLMKDSPKTEVASFRFKKLMRKAGAGSIEVMKSVISDLLSETVRKSVFGT